MPRKKPHEDHINHEAWAIPYGDLITLLLAFFVVMYATSSLNEGKYRVLSHSMVIAFTGKPRAPLPIQIGEKKTEKDSQRIMVPLPRDVIDQKLKLSQKSALPFKVRTTGQGELSGDLEAIATALEKVLEDLQLHGQVRLQRGQDWIEIAIDADVLFATAQAALSRSAEDVLQSIAALLSAYPHPLIIEGHTDNLPINTPRFPSNWELSAARAGRVVRLFESQGVESARLTLRAYADQFPVRSNETAEGRTQNRRVVVIIFQPGNETVGQRGAVPGAPGRQ